MQAVQGLFRSLYEGPAMRPFLRISIVDNVGQEIMSYVLCMKNLCDLLEVQKNCSSTQYRLFSRLIRYFR